MTPYNVLFITLDSWNRRVVGCLNDEAKEEELTPNLDKFSKRCITFSSAFSPSVKTSASVLSILSGCYPCKYGDWFTSISDKRTIVSEILKNSGYTTYGFTSNPCTSSLRKYDKGFDIFRDDGVLFKNIDGALLKVLLFIKTFLRNPYSPADKVNAQVFYHLERDTAPYFINVHYMDLHGPYIDREGWQFKNRIVSGGLWNKANISPQKITREEKQRLFGIYKKQMKFLDQHIGELIREIDDEKTLIIITGDHGDVFGVRGCYGHPDFFYNEMVNVPLFIKFPSDLNADIGVCSHSVSLVDLVPTINDVLGIESQSSFDGHSLLPLISPSVEKYKTEYIVSELSRKYACVIKGDWKLIADFGKSSFELYNWKEDYEERENVVNERLDIKQELEKILKEHIRKNKKGRAGLIEKDVQ